MHGPATKTITLTRHYDFVDHEEEFNVRVSRTAEHYNMRNVEAGFTPHIQLTGLLEHERGLTLTVWYAHDDMDGMVALSSVQMMASIPLDEQVREWVDRFIVSHPAGTLNRMLDDTMSLQSEQECGPTPARTSPLADPMPCNDDDTADAIMMQIDQALAVWDSTDKYSMAATLDDIQELVNKWQAARSNA